MIISIIGLLLVIVGKDYRDLHEQKGHGFATCVELFYEYLAKYLSNLYRKKRQTIWLFYNLFYSNQAF